MKLTRSLAIATLISLAGTASAQDGGNFGRPLDTPENRADMLVRFSARCVVSKAAATARKVLATQISSPQEAKLVKSLASVARDCFPAQLPAFPSTLYRNALAEAQYREQFRRGDPTPKETSLPASFGVVPAGQTGSPEQESNWQFAAIANCTVFADPAGAREWIIGPRSVPEEEKRFAAFKPALEKCVAPAVVDKITARGFRGFVATALLDRARRAGEVD